MKITFNGVRMAIFIAILTPLLASCYTATNKRPSENTSRVATLFYFKWDIYNPEEGKLLSLLDSIEMYSSDSFSVYRFRREHDQKKMNSIEQTDIVLDSTAKSSVIYSYLLFRQGAESGLYYANENDPSPKTKNVRQLLAQHISFNEAMFSTERDSLVYTSHPDPNSVVEAFVPKTKVDESYPDTSYYTYSKNFPKAKFSLSHTLDSTRQMKLQKVVFSYNPATINGKSVPKREMIFQLSVIPENQMDTTALRLLGHKTN